MLDYRLDAPSLLVSLPVSPTYNDIQGLQQRKEIQVRILCTHIQATDRWRVPDSPLDTTTLHVPSATKSSTN